MPFVKLHQREIMSPLCCSSLVLISVDLCQCTTVRPCLLLRSSYQTCHRICKPGLAFQPHIWTVKNTWSSSTTSLSDHYWRLYIQQYYSSLKLDSLHTWCQQQTKQEAQLSPRDRAMRRVSWNLPSCHATVQKLLVRQVLNQVLYQLSLIDSCDKIVL